MCGSGVALVVLAMSTGLLRSLFVSYRPPTPVIAYDDEIDRLLREKNYQAALPLLRLAAEIDFEDELRQWQLLEAASNTGNVEGQRLALLALARFQPHNPDISYWLAGVYLAEGDVHHAADCAAHSAELAPTRSDVRCRYGASLMALGRKTEAVEQYRAALQVDAGCQPARNALAGPLKGY
jgi:tetratricopeptide (TPR) repeat protein